MAISPFRLFLLLIFSFFGGAIVGAIYDIHRIIRVWFGVRYTHNRPERLLSRPLPLLRRPLAEIRQGRLKKSLLSVVIFFQDILLFCVAGIGVAVLNYTFNDGRFRFYSVVALLVGFLLYYFTLGKLVIFISEWIVFFLRAAFLVLFYLLMKPFVLIWKFLGKNIAKVRSNLWKALAKRRKKMYNKSKMKNCFEAAERGFF